MNPFTDLPDELLIGICSKMNYKELSQFVQTSKANYQVCEEVFSRKIIQQLNQGYIIFFSLKNPTGNSTSSVSLVLSSEDLNIIEFRQSDSVPTPEFYPWVLEGYFNVETKYLIPIGYQEVYAVYKDTYIDKTHDNVRQILKMLSEKGYIFSTSQIFHKSTRLTSTI